MRALTPEDRLAYVGEVDALRHRHVGLAEQAVAVGGLRPPCGQPVAAQHGVPAPTRGRCPVVAGRQLTALEGVAKLTHCINESVVFLTLAGLDGTTIRPEGTPFLNLGHILHEYHVWLEFFRVLMDGPGQYAQPLLAGLPALRLAVARAVGRGPHHIHRLIAHQCFEIGLEDVLCDVMRRRMVGTMHGDGLGIVVHRNIAGAAQCRLYAS